MALKLGVPIWTRRDGTEIYLDDMTDKHLVNAIAILMPWRRDCRARGEREMVRVLAETMDMIKREQRRRRKHERAQKT
jgi:hypothetical protein